MITIILDEPIMKPLDVGVDGGKGPLDILRNPRLVGCNDGRNDNIFVDIKSTTDGVDNPQR